MTNQWWPASHVALSLVIITSGSFFGYAFRSRSPLQLSSNVCAMQYMQLFSENPILVLSHVIPWRFAGYVCCSRVSCPRRPSSTSMSQRGYTRL